MEKLDIEKLRGVSLHTIASMLDIKVVRKKFLCPVHEDHSPSCSISVATNTWRCWSCGARGDGFELVQHVLGVSFIEAAKFIADMEHIILTDEDGKKSQEERNVPPPKASFNVKKYARIFEHPSISPEHMEWFQTRFIQPSVIRYLRLNSFGDWLQIPYYNQQNQLIGVQCRLMVNDATRPRFLFVEGTQPTLFGQQIIPLLRQGDTLQICEGISDVFAGLSSHRYCLGIPSATILTRDTLTLLAELYKKKGIRYTMYPDADSAGSSLFNRLDTAAHDMGFPLTRLSLPAGCKDFADYWVLTVNRNLQKKDIHNGNSYS